ncbi:MAG: DUF2309 domain-containing protein [Bacteroidetes bacterium]|nr:MAG: DUF2309 domain-containing protein [Bacteroidota bacterium]
MNKELLKTELQRACAKVAPYFPLDHFVAVNPYQAYADKPFHEAAAELKKQSGLNFTLEADYYLKKYREQYIQASDLREALVRHGMHTDLDQFLLTAESQKTKTKSTDRFPTLASVADSLSEKTWAKMIKKRISHWAASYFDTKQAIWKSPFQNLGLYEAWKAEFALDRSLELSGLKNSRAFVRSLPSDAFTALNEGLEKLGIQETELASYFGRLLYQHSGWSAYIAQTDWDNRLAGKEDTQLPEFLAILVSCERALLEAVEIPNLMQQWEKSRTHFAQKSTQVDPLLILQEAFELAYQRQLKQQFAHAKAPSEAAQIKVQAAFCIDVRSEVIRRNLEKVDKSIATLGYAGFFGMPVSYTPLGFESAQDQCPVLLKPTYQVTEACSIEDHVEAENRTWRIQLKKLKYYFKSSAISCFSFVSPLGLSFLPKLVANSFAWSRPLKNPNEAGLSKAWLDQRKATPNLEGISFEQKLSLAKNTLKGLSLTKGFANWILIVGHGANTTNNPHATGLDCGACGGHAGEVNARVAAGILNDKSIRQALTSDGIFIPAETLFIAGLHDTTTDEISLIYDSEWIAGREREMLELKLKLNEAGELARKERSLSLGINPLESIDKLIKRRSKDWSEIRPEWGLTGCSAFVIADRKRTSAIDLGGRSFLHSYTWQDDAEFKVLEGIMTAPMVVTSWINLQYFASTVDQKHFGAGNKTLHNITAGIGVLEGHSSDLRIGLPVQSIHNGTEFQHEPLKLNVLIEAPLEAINRILEKHQSIRNLVDNGWIHLFQLDENGKVAHQYHKNLSWHKEVIASTSHTQIEELVA